MHYNNEKQMHILSFPIDLFTLPPPPHTHTHTHAHTHTHTCTRAQLALKTVNCARSAFCSFLFLRAFFLSYNDGRGTGRGQRRNGTLEEGEGEEGEEGEGEGDESLKCKVTIKVCHH